MTYKKTIYILYVALFLYFVIAAATLINSSQGISFDPGLCIKMVDNGYKHIPFNHYSHPSPKNLNADESEIVTWWSPGQFAIPLLIQKCFGVKVSIALKLLIIICLLIAGLGTYRLFNLLISNKNSIDRNNDLTKVIVLVFLLFTIAQPFFWGSLFVYDGGGILMLAYCPWFIYWVVKINRINVYILLLLLIAAIFGFFLKTSFTSIFAGALLFLFLSKSISPDRSLKNQDFKKIARNGIYLGGIFIIYILMIRVFLDQNLNISDSSTGIRIQPRILFYPIAAPLLSLFSLDFLNKTFYWIIASAFILPLYYLVLKSNHISILYKYALISFISTCVLFYSFLYFLNLDVSYELRHYRIITILLTPAVFISFRRFGWGKYFAGILMVMYTAINIYHFSKSFSSASKENEPIYELSGIPSGYPEDLIMKIHNLDNLKDNGRDIFYFESDDEPSVALEIRNNRVLVSNNFVNFHFNNALRFKPTIYFGHNGGEIYLIYTPLQFKKDSVAGFTLFDKYKKFDKIYQVKGYEIYRAIASGNNR